jgi:hypothetical protein
MGGALLVLVLVCELPAARVPRPWEALCAGIAALDGLVGAHLGEQDTSLPGPAVAAAQAFSGQPTFVLLVEAQEGRWLARNRSTIEALLQSSLPDCRISAAHEYHLMELRTEGRAPT